MDKDKSRQALMTLLYVVLALWFLFAAYTEATGKWLTFPPAADAKEEEVQADVQPPAPIITEGAADGYTEQD